MTLQSLEKKLNPFQDPLCNKALKWFYRHFPPRPIANKTMHYTYSHAASLLMRELEAAAFYPA
jgi:hypothetical protein